MRTTATDQARAVLAKITKNVAQEKLTPAAARDLLAEFKTFTPEVITATVEQDYKDPREAAKVIYAIVGLAIVARQEESSSSRIPVIEATSGAPESQPELSQLQHRIKNKQAGHERAAKRTSVADIEEFEKLGIPVLGDNLGQKGLNDRKLIRLSQEQLAKVRAMPTEQRDSLQIVKVAANQNYKELAQIHSDKAYTDLSCYKIPGAKRGYYELTMGELPGSRNKTFDQQIDLLKEDQYITSAQAAWTGEVSAPGAGWDRIYQAWVRVAEVLTPALALGLYNDALLVCEYAPDKQSNNVGLAVSLE